MSSKKTDIRLPHFGPLNIRNIKEFLDKANGQFYDQYRTSNVPVQPIDGYRLLYTVGKGRFSVVDLVKRASDEEWFAVKVCCKKKLAKEKLVKNALNEKKLLQSLNFPFTVRMDYFSQDDCNIYFIMPFASGGDMFTHLRARNRFDTELTRFYAAQMVLALEYLSCVFVVHRDIKPENILVDQHGFLKLADFGLSKMVGGGRTFTICGTPSYIAPEVIKNQGYGRSADWWSLGVLIYEMAAGFPPFISRNTTKLYLKIMYGLLSFPVSFSTDLRDLLKKLLQRDVTRRLGNKWKGAEEVKCHAWFKNTDWMSLINRTTSSPYVPPYAGPGDVSNFPEATRRSLEDITTAHAYVDEEDIKYVDLFKDF